MIDETKRRFVRMLPVAALAGVTLKVGDVEAEAIEIKPEKKYILRLPGDIDWEQEDLDAIRAKIKEQGFPDMLVISGDVELYEL